MHFNFLHISSVIEDDPDDLGEEEDDSDDENSSSDRIHYYTTSIQIFKIYFFAFVASIFSITWNSLVFWCYNSSTLCCFVTECTLNSVQFNDQQQVIKVIDVVYEMNKFEFILMQNASWRL